VADGSGVGALGGGRSNAHRLIARTVLPAAPPSLPLPTATTALFPFFEAPPMKITSPDPSPTPPRPQALPPALNFQPRKPIRYKPRPTAVAPPASDAPPAPPAPPLTEK
jgi:hypothetical protein